VRHDGAPLLAKDEPPACRIVNARAAGHAVVVCDHASNRVPCRLEGLGLSAAHLASHIAWDPGAAEVARKLAQRLDAPLVTSGYSRLVIDCNRPPSSEESVATVSAGVIVPGNRSIEAADRARRIAELFRPYHAAIAALIDQRVAAGRPNLLLSIHSFTPELDGHRRPWQVGFAYGRDPRLACFLIHNFASKAGFIVGHNQPYSVDDSTDYTIPVHGEQRHLPHVLIEIRQDLLTTAAECAAWADRLAAAYRCSEPMLLS
jgi:predicted N-formylglutamate amidohydrolase